MEKIVREYFKKGYYIKKSLVDKKFCVKIKKYLSNQKSKINIPFSKVPWGYGNLLDKKVFFPIFNNQFLHKFCNHAFREDYDFNHLTINNKAAFIGSAVEWHQEIFNINTYAPGYTEKDYKKFMQIFIALDDQDERNGCLKIIPNSHHSGRVKFEDIIGDNLGHKRRVEYKTLEKIVKKLGMRDVPLKTGDALFFSHLLIHGSPSNHSSISRKSIVLQARVKKIYKKNYIFNRETKFRSNFIIKHFKKKIKSLTTKNIYKDYK